MNMHKNNIRLIRLAAGAAVLFSLVGAARANSNIDPLERHVWSENAGWIDFAPTNGVGGAMVQTNGWLEGFAWSENIGWIKLGSANGGPYNNTATNNWGVNLAGSKLNGFAWSENAGWINFHPTHSQVVVDKQTGRFSGFAWSENIGWIHFRQDAAPTYGLRTTLSLLRGTIILIQ
ncbi:MAG: hypothetical protein WC340_07070 [Kiritimatiellia bacterium]|jgi:hypothetical protein